MKALFVFIFVLVSSVSALDYERTAFWVGTDICTLNPASITFVAGDKTLCAPQACNTTYGYPSNSYTVTCTGDRPIPPGTNWLTIARYSGSNTCGGEPYSVDAFIADNECYPRFMVDSSGATIKGYFKANCGMLYICSDADCNMCTSNRVSNGCVQGGATSSQNLFCGMSAAGQHAPRVLVVLGMALAALASLVL